jgi:hypothetical protein
MKKIIFLAALAAFASCQKADEVQVKPVDDNLKINLAVDVKTKVSDTFFDMNDEVGIYIVNNNGDKEGTLASSGNQYDNVKFAYSGGIWTSSDELYWMDKSTPAVFYCYHPYGTPSNVTEYQFAVKSDQSALANYKASDFVWGKTSPVAPTEELIQIATNHLMSNALIYVKPGNGFTEETLAAAQVSVQMRNVRTSCAINLANGSVTANGSVANITPYKENGYYRALVAPQTVADGTALIVVTVNGTEYTLKRGFTFESGVQHKFTVKVNKTGSGVNVGVGDWDTDGEDHGGSAE